MGRQAWSIASTQRFGLPRFWDGSAPTSVLSGPAQASLALRPTYSLDLLSGAFFFGASAQGVAHLHRPMASEVHRQFLGQDFHLRVTVHLSRRTQKRTKPETEIETIREKRGISIASIGRIEGLLRGGGLGRRGRGGPLTGAARAVSPVGGQAAQPLEVHACPDRAPIR